MKTFAFAMMAFWAVQPVASAAPRLVVSTPQLTPESKLDLVLDQPVISTAEIGKTIDNTWLEIKPAMPSKLRWKAQNIAEVIPAQPPVIGGHYTFSVSANHQYLDATPVPVGQIAQIAVEPFRMLASNCPNRWSSDYSAATASVVIAFNDEVDPATAAAFISFASKNGHRVAAKLQRATEESAGYLSNHKPWAARWRDAPAVEITPATVRPHILVVAPVSPLPADDGWQLTVLKGMPNAHGGARTIEESRYEIGKIEPFKVASIEARTVANNPRFIELTFNQLLPSQLPADFLTKRVIISPAVKNLTAVVDGKTIKLTGDLNDEDVYQVHVTREITSVDQAVLESNVSKKVEFKHLQAFIALPSEDSGQLAHGNRKYRLFAQNLTSAHLRMKKLSGVDLIRTYQGYRNFTGRGPDNETIEHTAPIPYAMVVGKPMQEKDIPLDQAIDTSRVLTLDWNELLAKEMRYGVLFVEATGKALKQSDSNSTTITQSIVQLTDIGLAWKLTGGEAVIYAFSCRTGAPLPGVKFELFGEDATSLRSATSDASGLTTIPRIKEARHLLATLGEDTYVTAFDSTMETVGLWHFPVRYSWNQPLEASRKVLMFTDRSLYRPGETVRLKGIVRTLRGNTIEASKGGPARLVIVDPTDKEILTQAITISPNGSFDFTHQLAPSTTGTHLIRLEFTDELAAVEKAQGEEGDGNEGDDGTSWSERERIAENARFELPLNVEEFRRNAFEITQTIDPPALGATTVHAAVLAKYYQGQPVATGAVKHYSQVTTCNPYPERFRDYYFGNHRSYDWGYWYHYFGYKDIDENNTSHASQLEGETQLTADGAASIAVEIPQSDFPTPREVTVSTEVTDSNNQTLTARSKAKIDSSSVYVGISRNDTLSNVGKESISRIVAVDHDGKPFTKPLKITATVTREVNAAVRTMTQNGETTTRNDVTEETVSTQDFTLDPAGSAADGQAFAFTPKANGLHFITLRGNDPEGRPFATCVRTYVYGTTEYPWLYEDGLRIKLVAEKKSYKPGETARVLVLSPIEGTALVTVEREKVLRSFRVDLKADKPVIDIPLTDVDAPNAYVSVLIVKGSNDCAREFKQPQLRLGICELLVEERVNRLDVAIDAPAESYRPGEKVTLSGLVKQADGTPAVGAEVTLYAEDEGTLAVMGYDTPDPMAHFYQPRNLLVDAGTSFSSFVEEDPEKQSFNLKGLMVGGGGDLGKLADLMRKNFDPCAAWAPVLTTDASGKFSHTISLPDTLTRYRVIAIAHHKASRFGRAESVIVAKKDLMLEIKTPRFANQADVFSPQVLVQNASKYDGTWKIEYSAHHATGTPVCRALNEAAQTITLAAGASANVSFPTIAETTGEAVLSWKATPVSLMNHDITENLAKQLSDAVESRFVVTYPMPLIRQVKFVKLDQPGKSADLRKALDSSLLSGLGTLDLEFARSPLVDAAGSIDYLLHYPYGCVEQTTSSLIPWCTVEDLKDVIPAFAKVPQARVHAALQAGANRLLSMQLSNGSFTYWPGDAQTVDWATPYAGLGLMMAMHHGAKVPESSVESLTQYLIEKLRGMADTKSPNQLELHARSLLVLALAEKSQPAYQSAMIDRLAELTPAARSMLATAIAIGKPNDTKMARQIMMSNVPFSLQNDDWMPYTPNDALALLAWCAIAPNGPEADAALDRMLHNRNPYGHWQTTWMNGWSLIAISEYASHEKNRKESASLKFDSGNGSEMIVLSNETPTASRSLLLGSDLNLNVIADRNAFVRIRLASKPPIAPIQPVAKNGLSIDRIYQRVNPDGTAEPLTEAKPGDLIRVCLRVTLPRDDTSYMVIDDSLPAIFETVNSDFKSQNTGLGVVTSENDWTVSHSELRADRAVFFIDHVSNRGTYTVTYLARCTLAGKATAPPAKVESMYDPDQYALSASRLFTTP